MGAEGIDSSLVHLLKILLQAGIEPDLPDSMSLADVQTSTIGKDGRGFPVRFPAPQLL